MYDLIKKLYPICRSITGNGVRETLEIIKEHIPLETHEVPSGTKAFDWTVPREWNIKDAYIKNSRGKKIVDFKQSNLHVLNYSTPVNEKMSLAKLKEHLYSLPDYPDWVPYLTSYYKEDWGFCLTHKQLKGLPEDTYEVLIDSSLVAGSLTYGELYIKGKLDDEVLVSCYVCHPSLCNDNLSGIALAAFLAKKLQTRAATLRYSYRFLFIPETIGAIAWLSRNEKLVDKIKHGLIATCVGDPGISTYKKSRHGDAEIDRVVEHVLQHSNQDYKIVDFFPSGSDERQFSSPGFNLPVGSLMRTPYGEFPEYHTSADDLDFIKEKSLLDSLNKYLAVIDVLEGNLTYLNLNPKCEPMLGPRGLYRMLGGQKEKVIDILAIFWVLNFSDGFHSLLDIAEKADMDFEKIKRAADVLYAKRLLKLIDN